MFGLAGLDLDLIRFALFWRKQFNIIKLLKISRLDVDELGLVVLDLVHGVRKFGLQFRYLNALCFISWKTFRVEFYFSLSVHCVQCCTDQVLALKILGPVLERDLMGGTITGDGKILLSKI